MSRDYYDAHAAALVAQYQSADVAELHRAWIADLGETPGFACDIGAGSGRDANWLAAKGWDVVAVEPSAALRELAMPTSHPNVTWLDDTLPELQRLRALGHRFDLVLLSAVWQHIPPTQRERAFRILTELLKPGGTLVITLRHGKDEHENRARGFYPVSAAELALLAQRRAVVMRDPVSQQDQTRAHVSWETVIFNIPDDGTGSLPLLRQVIVNDNKAASHKLGLLRVLTRIAASAPGVVNLAKGDKLPPAKAQRTTDHGHSWRKRANLIVSARGARYRKHLHASCSTGSE
jgi:SAM-dependent methyltransferase